MHGPINIRFFHDILKCMKILGFPLTLGCNRLVPQTFQFIIHTTIATIRHYMFYTQRVSFSVPLRTGAVIGYPGECGPFIR